MKKICKRCGAEHETETEEEMKQFFYKKTQHGYFQNTCIRCVLQEHKEKYKSGKYNYNKNKNVSDLEGRFSIGNFSRCYHVSQFLDSNHPCFGGGFKINV